MPVTASIFGQAAKGTGRRPLTHWFTKDLFSPMASPRAFCPPATPTARAIAVFMGPKVQPRFTFSQAPLVARALPPLYRPTMGNGESFKRYLRPKIKAAGLTEEKLAVDRLGKTKAMVSGWWRTGKVNKEHLVAISRMPDLDAPLEELFAALRGEDPTSKKRGKWKTSSESAEAFVENVKRMRKFIPDLTAAAHRQGVNIDVLLDPANHLAEATLLDLDLIAKVLDTKPWVLLRPNSKHLDKRLEFVEDLLEFVGETDDKGRGALVAAMRDARERGDLLKRLADAETVGRKR